MSPLAGLHDCNQVIQDTGNHATLCSSQHDGKPAPLDYFSALGTDATHDLDVLTPAADGLVRLREHPDNDLTHHGERQRSRGSVRFPQESLHSFQFSSSANGGSDVLEFRRNTIHRTIDFVRLSSRWKSAGSLPGHSSPTALLSGDDVERSKTKSVGYSPVMHFGTAIEHLRATRRRQKSHPIAQYQEDNAIRGIPSNTSQKECKVATDHGEPSEAGVSPDASRSITPITPDDSEPIHTNTTSIAPHCPPSRTPTMTFSSSCSSFKSDEHGSSDAPAPTQEPLASSTIDEDIYKEEWSTSRQSSGMFFPPPSLHAPSRFLQHNQAILTTYDDWRIILSSDVAAFILVGTGGSSRSLIGKSVIDFIEESYRARFFDMVKKRREELCCQEEHSEGMVLVCGNVLPIIKQDGSRSAASLWLKEKRNDAGAPVYIWIFEEVFETVVHASVDDHGIIHSIDKVVQDLYSYSPEELVGQSIQTLLPALSKTPDWELFKQTRYFGSKTKLGATFPVITKLHTVCQSENKEPGLSETEPSPCYDLRITSIPIIAGMVTIRRDGVIEGCNSVFANYMFGYSKDELVANKTDISQLMPQLQTLLQSLHRDDLLQQGVIINNHICRKLVAEAETPAAQHDMLVKSGQRRLTEAPNGQTLPVLIAVHRDGTPFEVQLQLKEVEGSDQVCALWITFDRDQTFSRFGHTKPSRSLDQKHLNGSTSSELQQSHTAAPTENADCSNPLAKEPPSEEQEKAPMRIVTSFSKPTFFLNEPPPSPLSPCPVAAPSVTPARTLPSSLSFTPINDNRSSSTSTSSTQLSKPAPSPPTPTPIEYSAQTAATTIDDYIILDTLGQGAYGLVKVAVRKDDPLQTKVVIKFVIKSRILVDCWTKDQQLGVIPVEIHILHTLRKIPHENCSDMLDYFEDDDYYYIVMGLHGPGMDLFDYIEINNSMMDDEIRVIFKQVAEAVRHLHTHKIVHRDIKDENVVLDQNGGVRLIDFGSAAYLKGRRYDTFVGTLDYAAPEILAGQTYEGPPQDIWALGILLYTLVYRENPFYDIDEILSRDLRVPYVKSEGSLDLIRKMLDRDVDRRLTIHDVLEHPWIKQG